MHSRLKRFRPFLFMALLPCLALEARAGDLASCRGLDNTDGYKVLLDDLSIAPASADLRQQMERLQFRLEGELQSLKQETGTAITVIWCEGRRPRGKTDFSNDLIELLRIKRVVLEIWVSVYDQEALVSFLMIPVRPGERAAHGFHKVSYTLGKTDKLLDLFKKKSELPGLGLLCLALYDLKQGNASLAHGLLKKAELWLKNDADPDLVGYIRQLREEARQMACQSRVHSLACSDRGDQQ
jgi:hypothetical protein